jgi:2-phosphoglycerate kinase
MSRSWQVLLIGGASGTGKTSVSYRIAQHFGIGISEVDDFQLVLARMTTPEEQPILHYWRTHPEVIDLSPEKVVQHIIAVGGAMMPALEVVIENHLASQTPIVLEGDFILPSLATQANFGKEQNNGRVQAVFLVESNEAQLRLNYLQREPESGEQRKRARVSWLFGQWLKREVQRVGLPAVEARPWEDVFERTIAAIR